METSEILVIIETGLGEGIVEVQESIRQDSFLVSKDRLLELCSFLYNNEKLFVDFLSSVTAVDNGDKDGTLDVIYHLVSLPFEFDVTLKVSLPRQTENELPTLPSVSSIWAAANWHEREAYDLVGVKFDNHPDLRRILLPKNWEGHPLRKDYQEQEYYHGVKVKY